MEFVCTVKLTIDDEKRALKMSIADCLRGCSRETQNLQKFEINCVKTELVKFYLGNNH